MAQITHRVQLQDTDFPLLAEDMGHTVLVPSVPEVQQEAQPQVMYCHNMMPTKEGMASVGFNAIISAVANDNLVNDVRIIYGNAFSRLHMAVSQNGSVYILKAEATAWITVPFTEDIIGKQLTLGTVNGITYVFFRDVGCFLYNESSDQFVPVSLAGLDLTTILGITASYGYLIAYTATALAWSSTASPTDFIPSSTTGAGGGGVADAKGSILFAVPNSLGILIYTEANVVAATFTGNKQYPFKLREVTNSKGALSLDLVAYEANSEQHFTFGKAGIQACDSRTAQVFLPELTDFLTGERFEDFDDSTLEFSYQTLSTAMLKKVKLVSSRYLVISYGVTSFTHALIYDLVLQRLGKVKFTHTDVFEYIGGAYPEIAGHTVAFLQSDGSVSLLDLSVGDAAAGTLLLGRFQYVRNRTMRLQHVNVANVHSGDTLAVYAIPSFNGSDLLTPVSGYLADNGTKTRKYNFDTEGTNIVVALLGKVDLNTVSIIFTPGSRP